MMKKIGIILLVPFVLAACTNPNTPKVIENKQIIVPIPSSRFFVCPQYQLEKPIDEYTEKDIADLIVTLETNNRVCKDSLNAIKAYLQDSKRRLEQTG